MERSKIHWGDLHRKCLKTKTSRTLRVWCSVALWGETALGQEYGMSFFARWQRAQAWTLRENTMEMEVKHGVFKKPLGGRASKMFKKENL